MMPIKKKSDNYENLKCLTLIMLLTSVFFLTCGLTYAFYRNFFKGTTNNIIEAGRLSFYFDESNATDGGIDIQNAFPISDTSGKRLSGNKEYFDFSVSAVSLSTDIAYQIYVEKLSTSTLRDDWIKIYLTLKNKNGEEASPLVMDAGKVKTFSQLAGDEDTKLVYSGIANNANEEYVQEFRLRMWIGEHVKINEENSADFSNKSFSVKVKVTANQE